ncbi:MAG: hypothetical protein QM734_15185 [Cyclobacteriaceae bacterium]
MKNLRVLVIILGFAAACTYSPNEKYVSPIKQKLPNATITLNNYNSQDTIYIYQAADFQFNISAANITITEVDVFLSGVTVFSTSSATGGTFSISGNNLKTGTYELKVQFKSNSGSGSLADVSGAEQVQVWKSWTLKIDVDPPAKPILQKSIENGFLKISWTPFKKAALSTTLC